MSGPVRLGDAEWEAYRALLHNGGRWDASQRALWDNRYWTQQLMASLARKGVVAVNADGSFVAVAKLSQVSR